MYWAAETGISQGLAGSHSSERPCLSKVERITLWFPPAHTHTRSTQAHVHCAAYVPTVKFRTGALLTFSNYSFAGLHSKTLSPKKLLSPIYNVFLYVSACETV